MAISASSIKFYRNVDVDETEDAVQTYGGQIFWIHAMNLTAALAYLHLYDGTVADVIVGTTTPDLTFPLATQGDTNGAGFTLTVPNHLNFENAITIACTTGLADTNGPATNTVIVNMGIQ